MKKGSHHSENAILKIKERRKLQTFSEETREKMRMNRLNWRWSDDVKRKMSETRKKLVQERPELREVAKRVGEANKGKYQSDIKRSKNRIESERNWKNVEFRRKQTESRKQWWEKATPEERGNRLQGLRSSYTPKRNKKVKNAVKRWWESCNPEVKSKRIKKAWMSAGKKPNKLELRFQEFLNRYFPGEWKYVGNGEIWIAGKCPDFWNTNGRKQIIELFGSYFHKPEDEQVRKDHFSKYGYETLVIWESELKDLDSVRSKIQNFC